MTKLLINENPLMVLPTLAKEIGLNEAIILQQIHYWLDARINQNFKEGKNWVYNSYSKWQEQFSFFSEITIRRSIKSLEKQGFLISKRFNLSSFNKTKWYTINYDKLARIERSSSAKNKIVAIKNYDEEPRIYRCDQFDRSMRSKRSEEPIKLIDSYMYTETTTETTNSLSSLSQDDSVVVGEREGSLISIWEKNIPSLGRQLTITKARKKRLREVFRDHFESSTEKWEKFTELISQNSFLMGTVTNFRVSLDWAIKEENIFKILEGAYTNKKEVDKNKVDICTKAKLSLLDDNSSLDPNWKSFLREATKKFGEPAYVSWFSQLEFIASDENNLKVKVPTEFAKQNIEIKHERGLLQIAKKIFGVSRISFETDAPKRNAVV